MRPGGRIESIRGLHLEGAQSGVCGGSQLGALNARCPWPNVREARDSGLAKRTFHNTVSASFWSAHDDAANCYDFGKVTHGVQEGALGLNRSSASTGRRHARSSSFAVRWQLVRPVGRACFAPPTLGRLQRRPVGSTARVSRPLVLFAFSPPLLHPESMFRDSGDASLLHDEARVFGGRAKDRALDGEHFHLRTFAGVKSVVAPEEA